VIEGKLKKEKGKSKSKHSDFCLLTFAFLLSSYCPPTNSFTTLNSAVMAI
jgi:hypothetical protein